MTTRRSPKRPCRRRGVRVAAATLPLLVLASVLEAQARRPGGQQRASGQPYIERLEISLEEPGGSGNRGTIAPGETAFVEQGDVVRFRMRAVPQADRRGDRYPSTRYEVNSNRNVDVARNNTEVGAVTLKGVAPHMGSGNAVVVRYEVLDPLRMNDRLRTGRFYVRVVDPRPAAGVTCEVASTVCIESEGASLHWTKQVFGDAIGAALLEGWLAGRMPQRFLPTAEVRCDTTHKVCLRAEGSGREVADLEMTERFFGPEAARALSYRSRNTRYDDDRRAPRYRDPADQRGVTVYEHDDFRGRKQFFVQDQPDLRAQPIGNDSVSSLQVPPGCEVALFEHTNYRGRSVVIDYDLPSFRGLPVGNDELSSLRIYCRGR